MIDTQQFKERLTTEKDLVLKELNAVALLDPQTGEWEAKSEAVEESAPDANDLGDRFEDFEERNALTTTLAKKLGEIEKALASIESGTYGTCTVCQADIEHDRLTANPAADTCIEHINN